MFDLELARLDPLPRGEDADRTHRVALAVVTAIARPLRRGAENPARTSATGASTGASNAQRPQQDRGRPKSTARGVSVLP